MAHKTDFCPLKRFSRGRKANIQVGRLTSLSMRGFGREPKTEWKSRRMTGLVSARQQHTSISGYQHDRLLQIPIPGFVDAL